MRLQFNHIDKEVEFRNDGYNKYIQNIEIDQVDQTDFDGLLSLCIDSRLAVTQICGLYKSKQPISTAGNALQNTIRRLSLFTSENVVVTHGLHPSINPSGHPACGGHSVAFIDDPDNVYKGLIQSLKPYVKRSFDDYDPFVTAQNLGRIWDAIDTRFYDHSSGLLYNMDDTKLSLGVDPKQEHAGVDPAKGQDPPMIVINTLNRPFFSISRGHRALEIGGVAEIFYPETSLPENVLESLIYGLQQHYLYKNASGEDTKILEEGHFRSSDTVVLLADSEAGIKNLSKSLLSVKNSYHKKFIEGYFEDPKDIVIGIVPEMDNKFIQITNK